MVMCFIDFWSHVSTFWSTTCHDQSFLNEMNNVKTLIEVRFKCYHASYNIHFRQRFYFCILKLQKIAFNYLIKTKVWHNIG
jgi:hypothetical protein